MNGDGGSRLAAAVPWRPALAAPMRSFVLTWTVLAAATGVGFLLVAAIGGGLAAVALAVPALAVTAVGAWQLAAGREHPGILLLPGLAALVAVAGSLDGGVGIAALVGAALAVTGAGYFLGRRWALLLTGLLAAAGVLWVARGGAARLPVAGEMAVLAAGLAVGSWVHHRNAVFTRQVAVRRARLFEATADAIVVVDADQRIVEVNRAAVETFGYRAPGDLLGQDLGILIPERSRFDHAAYVAWFRASGIERRAMRERMTLRGLRADGSEFPCEATIARVTLDGETLLMAVVRDVTEREEARWRAEEMAEFRLRLVASVSQEVRTPLAAVLGLADVLREEALDDEGRRRVVSTIAQRAQEMSVLVEDLLVGARAELGELTVAAVPVDLRAQVCQVVERQGVAARVRVVGEATALGDPDRVRQVVRELLCLILAVSARALVELSATGPVASVAVSGEGGPPAPATASIPVGLGAAMVRHVVGLMGGRLHVEVASAGPSYRVDLPVPGA